MLSKINPVDLLFLIGLCGILGLVIVEAPLWAFIAVGGVLSFFGWIFWGIDIISRAPLEPPVSEQVDEPVSKSGAE